MSTKASQNITVTKLLLLLVLPLFVVWLIPAFNQPKDIPNYLALHTLMEITSIVVSVMVFSVGWNSRNQLQAGSIVLLASVFFAVGILDALHTISYGGMPDFITHNDAQKHLYFWLAARFWGAIGLLIITIKPWRAKLKFAHRSIYLSVSILWLATVCWFVWLHPDLLPEAYITGSGLTVFKKSLEYLIIAINVATALMIALRFRESRQYKIEYLFGAVCFMALSEYYFTFYTTMSGSYNVLGHLYKVIAYLMIYRAIVVSVIEQPYNELAQAQQNLATALTASNTGLWFRDLRSGKTQFSREWKAQLGYLPEELDDNFSTWESLLHPDDQAAAMQYVNEFIASKQTFYENEFRLRHRDGRYRWILARGEVQVDETGFPVRLIGAHIDITDRKNAEQLVQEEKQRFHDFSNSSVDWLWEMDADLRFSYFSDNFQQHYGMKPEMILGKTRAELFSELPLNSAAVLLEHMALLNAQQPFRDFEYCVRAATGGLRWLSVSGVPIFNSKNEFVGYRGAGQNITQRKQEESISLRYKTAIETTHDGFWIVDGQGNILQANNAYSKMSGYSVEELQGMHVSQLEINEVSPAEVEAHINKIIAQGWDVFETRHRCKDGNILELEVTASFISESKQVLAFLRDITERKRTEIELRIAATAFESHEGIVITDANSNILRVNKAFASITGYIEQEVLGKNHHILNSGRQSEAFYKEISERIRDHDSWEGEIWSKRKNGEIYPEYVTITAVKDQNGNVSNYVGTHLDITERQDTLDKLNVTADELTQANFRIEEERALLVEKVEERTAQLRFANQAKDSFLATMSHEIRTPLGGLMGMMELLDISKLTAKQREILGAARESANGLLRIVNDILDWSKIEAGKMELAPRPSSITTLLKGVANTYTSIANAKGIGLHLRLDKKLGAAHLFDRLRISQVLNNLTSNAIKFTEQGSVEISAEQVCQRDEIQTIRFSVKDSGIGISADQQVRLFQQYEQGTKETARMYGGTGLGLAISHRLTQLMGGLLRVESEVGTGSTFSLTVDFPIAKLADRREQQQAINIPDRRKSEKNPTKVIAHADRVKILIVDDHPINRMLLKQQLELLGLQMEAASSGTPALSLWQSQHFDLVITDCHMPEMDGYELTRRIRAAEQKSGNKRIPIIAWTANVLAEERARCEAAGMDDMLTKPTELSELNAMLIKWLDEEKMQAMSPEPVEVSLPTKSPRINEVAIDFAVLNQYGFNQSAQHEMLQTFNTQNHFDVATLKETLSKDDAAVIAKAAHRIKGASRMVGAKEFEAISIRIEQAAKQNDLQGARVAAVTLDDAADSFAAALDNFLQSQ